MKSVTPSSVFSLPSKDLLFPLLMGIGDVSPSTGNRAALQEWMQSNSEMIKVVDPLVQITLKRHMGNYSPASTTECTIGWALVFLRAKLKLFDKLAVEDTGLAKRLLEIQDLSPGEQLRKLLEMSGGIPKELSTERLFSSLSYADWNECMKYENEEHAIRFLQAQTLTTSNPRQTSNPESMNNKPTTSTINRKASVTISDWKRPDLSPGVKSGSVGQMRKLYEYGNYPKTPISRSATPINMSATSANGQIASTSNLAKSIDSEKPLVLITNEKPPIVINSWQQRATPSQGVKSGAVGQMRKLYEYGNNPTAVINRLGTSANSQIASTRTPTAITSNPTKSIDRGRPLVPITNEKPPVVIDSWQQRPTPSQGVKSGGVGQMRRLYEFGNNPAAPMNKSTTSTPRGNPLVAVNPMVPVNPMLPEPAVKSIRSKVSNFFENKHQTISGSSVGKMEVTVKSIGKSTRKTDAAEVSALIKSPRMSDLVSKFDTTQQDWKTDFSKPNMTVSNQRNFVKQNSTAEETQGSNLLGLLNRPKTNFAAINVTKPNMIARVSKQNRNAQAGIRIQGVPNHPAVVVNNIKNSPTSASTNTNANQARKGTLSPVGAGPFGSRVSNLAGMFESSTQNALSTSPEPIPRNQSFSSQYNAVAPEMTASITVPKPGPRKQFFTSQDNAMMSEMKTTVANSTTASKPSPRSQSGRRNILQVAKLLENKSQTVPITRSNRTQQMNSTNRISNSNNPAGSNTFGIQNEMHDQSKQNVNPAKVSSLVERFKDNIRNNNSRINSYFERIETKKLEIDENFRNVLNRIVGASCPSAGNQKVSKKRTDRKLQLLTDNTQEQNLSSQTLTSEPIKNSSNTSESTRTELELDENFGEVSEGTLKAGEIAAVNTTSSLINQLADIKVRAIIGDPVTSNKSNTNVGKCEKVTELDSMAICKKIAEEARKKSLEIRNKTESKKKILKIANGSDLCLTSTA